MEFPQRVLLTGCAGFIGSHLADTLTHNGVFVIGVDNLSNGSLENLKDVNQKNFVFYQLDVRSHEFRDLVRTERYDAVLHFAANAYVPPSVENPYFDFENNLVATFLLLETLRQIASPARIITVSSAAVYGNPVKLPMCETDPVAPIAPYGVSKLGIEKYTEVFSLLYGLKTACLRLFSTYGPRQKKQIIFDFICKLRRNPEELEILGDGTQERDMIYVKDVVNAVLLLLNKSPFKGEFYNLAVGKAVSTRKLAELVSRAMDLAPRFKFTGAIRPGDPERWRADISRLQQLGFKPQYSLEEGIKETVKWGLSVNP